MERELAAGNEAEVVEEGSSCAGDTTEYTDAAPFQEDLRLVASVSTKQMRQQAPAETGAVLTVLGGKASCRRKFVLSVQLQDDQGRLVHRDLPIVASVAFAHDHLPVRPPDSGEPPLFTTFNGVEFSAHDNPTRMLAGRATFKLALSLLSSKYENRLFCICFTPYTQPRPLCPPCFSPPIRSISRKRTSSAAAQYGAAQQHLFLDGAGSPLHLPRISTAAPYLHAGLMGRFPHSPDHSSTAAGAGAENTDSSVDGTSHLQHVNTRSRSEQVSIKSRSPEEAFGIDDHRCNGDHLPLLSNKRHSAGCVGPNSDQNMMAQLMLSPTSIAPSFCCNSNCTMNNAGAMCRLNTPSPVDSGSPNSIITLTSESCIDHHSAMKDNKTQYVSRFIHSGNIQALQASMGRPLSAPSPPVSCTKPLRPQASIGGCKVPFGSTILNAGISRTSMAAQRAGHNDVTPSVVDDAAAPSARARLEEGTHQQQSTRFVLGAMQHLSAAAALATPVQQRLDSLMRNFLWSNGHGVSGTLSSRRSMCSSLLEDGAEVRSLGHEQQLEEEERAIHYLELSLYEVTMEIQKRKEEVRIKRRRLLDDHEARLQYNLVLPSWLSNIM